ncbi:Hypothetical protein UVM_LOCUS452 [uncultured virus]|nr:Hypothetical protein UVM_LOCUS452 [uncultured virus]
MSEEGQVRAAKRLRCEREPRRCFDDLPDELIVSVLSHLLHANAPRSFLRCASASLRFANVAAEALRTFNRCATAGVSARTVLSAIAAQDDHLLDQHTAVRFRRQSCVVERAEAQTLARVFAAWPLDAGSLHVQFATCCCDGSQQRLEFWSSDFEKFSLEISVDAVWYGGTGRQEGRIDKMGYANEYDKVAMRRNYECLRIGKKEDTAATVAEAVGDTLSEARGFVALTFDSSFIRVLVPSDGASEMQRLAFVVHFSDIYLSTPRSPVAFCKVPRRIWSMATEGCARHTDGLVKLRRDRHGTVWMTSKCGASRVQYRMSSSEVDDVGERPSSELTHLPFRCQLRNLQRLDPVLAAFKFVTASGTQLERILHLRASVPKTNPEGTRNSAQMSILYDTGGDNAS